ncbi:MAG: hypothetical protein EOP46_06400 [Sphingobacteriaceae bacterium]|nr:MAG: hypothetical protein EOP46_06400 [Sphingobacteriaceae bacterium]
MIPWCNKIKFLTISKSLILLTLAIFNLTFAKSKPNIYNARQLAFKRAQSLDNGVSVSALDQTWNKNILQSEVLTATDCILLKKLGFRSIRLPVAFTYFEAKKIPLSVVYAKIDKVIKLCKTYGFTLVLDYHYGNLADSNYLTETPKIIGLWRKVAQKYKNQSAGFLLYEIYNEPLPINPQIWKDAAYNIVTAIRKIDKKRTLIVGASNYNSIYELSRFVRLADENIIYTFHFYEPFFFTHQGAEWVGKQVATTGVPFPYNAENFPELHPDAGNTWGETNYKQYKTDGNEQSIIDKLGIVKQWSNKYGVPILCGEYGVYNKYADLPSRCRYIKAVRKALKQYKIPGMMWDYNTSFSIFEGKPSMANLPVCMQNAIGYKPKK